MNKLLDTHWHIGTAIGEAASAFILVFLILAIPFSIDKTYDKKRKVQVLALS